MRAGCGWGSSCCFDCLDYFNKYISLGAFNKQNDIHLLPPLPSPPCPLSWVQQVPRPLSFSGETLCLLTWSALPAPPRGLYVNGTAMQVPLIDRTHFSWRANTWFSSRPGQFGCYESSPVRSIGFISGYVV